MDEVVERRDLLHLSAARETGCFKIFLARAFVFVARCRDFN